MDQLGSNYDPAIAACEEATKQFPTIWRYYYQLGRALHARAVKAPQKADDTKRFERAAAAYRKAANGGHPAALCNLALYYARTDRPPIQQDHAIAFAYALRSFELEATTCVSVVGDYYRDGLNFAADYKKARQYYGTLAGRGGPDAVGRIASMYALDKTVSGTELQDARYIGLAREGNRFRSFVFGLFADQGIGGFAKDPKVAAQFLLASIKSISKETTREFTIVAEFFKNSAQHRLARETKQEFQRLLYATTNTHEPTDGNLLSSAAQDAIASFAK